MAGRPGPVRRLVLEEQAGLAADTIQAGFQIGEISVDTEQVAALVRRAVGANRLIRLRLGCQVLEASYADAGGVHLRCRTDEGSVQLHYRYGINCTWEDRLRLDQSLVIRPMRPWLMRYKAAVTNHVA